MTLAASLCRQVGDSALPWQVQVVDLYKYRRVFVAIAGGSYPALKNIDDMLQVDHVMLETDERQWNPVFPVIAFYCEQRFFI